MKNGEVFTEQMSSFILLDKVDNWKKSYEKQIKDLEEKIANFCSKHGYEKLEDVHVLDRDKKYMGAELNSLGYVANVSNLDSVFEKVDVPLDIKMGYYKIVDDELILDEAMRARLWEE